MESGSKTALQTGDQLQNPPGPNNKDKNNPGGKSFTRESIELIVSTLVLLIIIRFAIGETRSIPSSSMEPTLQINDRLFVEKLSKNFGHPVERGDILVFYPPPIEVDGHELSTNPITILGRLTGLPFLPNDPAFIKRVVGLPGDHIVIQSGVGVFINGQLLDESAYIKERPNYNLMTLGDISGSSMSGAYISPYPSSPEPIIVPPGHLFMMGDNRNNSGDSHVWGFLDQKRVIGRAFLLFWRPFSPPEALKNKAAN